MIEHSYTCHHCDRSWLAFSSGTLSGAVACLFCGALAVIVS